MSTGNEEAVKRVMMGFFADDAGDPQAAWGEALRNIAPGPRTLYVHLPYCRSRCLFFPIYYGRTDEAGMAEYLGLLHREIERAADTELSVYPVNAVYLGGGTPTDLSAAQLGGLLELIRTRFKLANDCEITVEARISGFTADKMSACIEHGANRFSLGVQTFNTELRRRLGRVAERKEVLEALRRLTDYNQAAVVIDLLYGLPGQRMEDWVEDQRIVLEETDISGLDHYRLNLHEGVPLAEAIKSGRLPSLPGRADVFAMYQRGEELMESAGAARLSIKHYALQYRERNANNDISGRKNVCYPFGIHGWGRLGGYFFRQAETLEKYRELVLRGEKPLEYAGLMPRGHEVSRVIAGQIARNRGINLGLAVRGDVEYAERVLESCGSLLGEWLELGLLREAQFGWLRMSPEMMFDHRIYSKLLLERVSAAYRR